MFAAAVPECLVLHAATALVQCLVGESADVELVGVPGCRRVKIKVDENLHIALVEVLAGRGHEVRSGGP